MIQSGLGLDPWDVFHQGLSELTGLSFGTVTIAVGALVLLLWIPLRQRPGLGTVSNVVVIGLAVDASAGPAAGRRGRSAARIALAGRRDRRSTARPPASTSAPGSGPGPRDGLMTGFVARRPGRSIRLVRTVIEVTVLAPGWLLGGTVGLGTVAYALAIGPLAQLFIPMFAVAPSAGATGAGMPRSRSRRVSRRERPASAWPSRPSAAGRHGPAAESPACADGRRGPSERVAAGL